MVVIYILSSAGPRIGGTREINTVIFLSKFTPIYYISSVFKKIIHCL